jgi:hypothetical protein
MEYTASRHSTAQPLGNSPAQQSIVSIGHSTVQLSAWDAVQHSSDAQHRTVQYCTVLCCAISVSRTVLVWDTIQHNAMLRRAAQCFIIHYSTIQRMNVQYNMVLYCTVLCCAVLYCTVLCCAVLRCAMRSTVQRSAAHYHFCCLSRAKCRFCLVKQYNTVLYCAVLRCTVRYCTVTTFCSRHATNKTQCCDDQRFTGNALCLGVWRGALRL